MSKLGVATIYGMVTGVSSQIFMLYVFFNESILGQGVTYVEPNRPLAFIELLLVLFGLVFLTFAMIALTLSTSKGGSSDKRAEPYGIGDEKDGVYA